jgi:hypothetical protein
MNMNLENKSKLKKVKKLPIYKKGEEILDVVHQIGKLIPKDNEHLLNVKAEMLDDAMQLSVKVAGAESGQLYDLKMESAAIIRKAARDLMLANYSLEMFGFKEVEYLKILGDLIEEYRLLFIEWVKSFDQQVYIVDRWGLFNPKGVGPHDNNPETDVSSLSGLTQK